MNDAIRREIELKLQKEGLNYHTYRVKVSPLLRALDPEPSKKENHLSFFNVKKITIERTPEEIEKLKKIAPLSKIKLQGTKYLVDNNKRYNLKTARFLTRKLNLNKLLLDHHIKTLADNINEELFSPAKIEVLKGEEITEAYREAVGNSSCMTNECAEYTKMYEMNPDKISLLVAHRGSSSARCLLWKLDCGEYYTDKIYYNASNIVQQLRKYIEEKEYLNFTRCRDFQEKLKVSGIYFENGNVPYMDTFCKAKKVIKNGIEKFNLSFSGKCDYLLKNTNGRISENYECDICNSSVSEDEIMEVNDIYICTACFSENYVYCANCDEATHIDNMFIVRGSSVWYTDYRESHYCSYCTDTHAFECDYCGELWYIGDKTRTNHGDELCPECYDEYKEKNEQNNDE